MSDKKANSHISRSDDTTSDAGDSSSSASEWEDESGNLAPPEFDIALAETLLAIRRNDESKLQDCQKRLANVAKTFAESASRLKVPSDRRYTLKDRLLDEIREKGSNNAEDDEDDSDLGLENSDNGGLMSIREEQEALRREAIAILHESDDDEDCLMEVKQNEDAADQTHKHQEGMGLMKQYFDSRSSNSPDDDFLKDYFLNQRWKEFKESPAVNSIAALDESLEEVETQDAFERSFNFRFEEKDGNKITGHSRKRPEPSIADVLRPQSKRSQKRKEKKEQERKLLRDQLAEDQSIPLDVEASNKVAEEDYPSDQEWFLCDGCEKPIQAGQIKYDCVECSDYSLCKKCQKSVKHDHSLRKSRVDQSADPPASWKLAVNERKHGVKSFGDSLTASIMSKVTFKPSGYKYIEVAPLDGGLTFEDMFSLDESELNKKVPPATLSAHLPPEKVKRLLKASRKTKVEPGVKSHSDKRARTKSHKSTHRLPADDPKADASEGDVHSTAESERSRVNALPKISRKRLQAFGLDTRLKRQAKVRAVDTE